MQTTLGTCHHDCPDSCGWIATVSEGRAVKLRGNPDHPYSRGELCPKVNKLLDRVYAPDRLLHPLIRTGAKGEGQFRQASWDEALGLVAERWHGIIAAHGGEALLPWGSAGTQGMLQMSSLDRRLFGALGASRTTGALCGAVAYAGTSTTLGSPRASDPMDIRHAELILLWGTNTRLTNRHLWPFVEEARGRGARVVVIDPVRTITAESADWFIQPRPGTDAALVLAMIHILIRDDLVDGEYVDAYTRGFESLAARAAEWPPARAADVCGLTVDEIEQLARAYGTTQRSFIRTLIGAEHREHGAMLFRTLSCLPALTGAWRHLGGGYAQSCGAWQSVQVDDSVLFGGPRDTRALPFAQLGEVLLDEQLAPPVMGLMVWNGNPIVSVPNAGLVRRGLARENLFTVVSEQFLTDTARYADVVFPATTQIEQLDVVGSWGHLYLGWNEPAIAPLGEAVPNTELWRRLGHALGLADPRLFESDEALLRAALPTVDLELLRSRGWVRLDVPEPLLPYANGEFLTADGRVNFEFAAAAQFGLDPVPTYTAPAEGPATEAAQKYPLVLLTPKQHTRFLNSSYSHLPAHHGPEGEPFVELDPADAAARGLADGSPATVFNDRGTLTLPVRISTRLRPGVAAVPWGWWASQHHDGRGANELTSSAPTDWGGGVAYHDTLVEVAAKA